MYGPLGIKKYQYLEEKRSLYEATVRHRRVIVLIRNISDTVLITDVE